MIPITPEIKKQLDEQKKQCPFCQIIEGKIQAAKAYEDDKIECVLDINPAVKGHMLIMPKEHYPIIPYVPHDEFVYIFGKMPALVKCIKDAFICFGATIFLANGGVAGQRSPHFLFHLFPREKGDGLNVFEFNAKTVNDQEQTKAQQVLATNIPPFMQKHFSQYPQSWHTGNGTIPPFLKDNTSSVLYQDEQAIVVLSKKPQTPGHIEIYSKEEEKEFDKLSAESSAHLFSIASYVAMILFEGLGAQGTNIILKSGISGDNPSGKLCLHVLARKENDGLDFNWEPMADKGDLKSIAATIADKTFMLTVKEGKKITTINLDTPPPTEKKIEARSDSEPGEIERAILRIVRQV